MTVPGECGIPRFADRVVERVKGVLGGLTQDVGGLVEGGLEGEPSAEDAVGDAGEGVLVLSSQTLRWGMPEAVGADGTSHREAGHRARFVRGRNRG